MVKRKRGAAGRKKRYGNRELTITHPVRFVQPGKASPFVRLIWILDTFVPERSELVPPRGVTFRTTSLKKNDVERVRNEPNAEAEITFAMIVRLWYSRDTAGYRMTVENPSCRWYAFMMHAYETRLLGGGDVAEIDSLLAFAHELYGPAPRTQYDRNHMREFPARLAPHALWEKTLAMRQVHSSRSESEWESCDDSEVEEPPDT